jgi:hypothetical protein
MIVIEYRTEKSGEIAAGVVFGKYSEGVLAIMITRESHSNYRVSFEIGSYRRKLEGIETIEDAKAAADQLYKQWRESAELIHVDEVFSCPECNDTGLTIHFIPSEERTTGYVGENGEIVEPFDVPCPCRKIPTSLWSIKERVKGK